HGDGSEPGSPGTVPEPVHGDGSEPGSPGTVPEPVHRGHSRLDPAGEPLQPTAHPVLARSDVLRAEVRVTNTGPRAVRETVQVYVSDCVTSVSWADKELKAYRQVDLAPGQSEVVTIDLAVSECTIVDAAGGRVVEAGDFELRVGPSSREEALLRAGFSVA
ncbi:MAG: fibronectin type III-like domain-contianing protein, partial [Propionicimonas sp.]|nr:fibronectin type III-like domain-contianing protein [Propionicimonas sp.]